MLCEKASLIRLLEVLKAGSKSYTATELDSCSTNAMMTNRSVFFFLLKMFPYQKLSINFSDPQYRILKRWPRNDDELIYRNRLVCLIIGPFVQ